jgi:hypothetical protein
MKFFKIILLPLALLFLAPRLALAHCPLCTVGAGALAVAAAAFGVNAAPIGVFIGAFSLALALWLAKLVKKIYIPQQKTILTIGIFLATIIPIMPLIREYRPLYISLFGNYGSLLHNTYMINLYLLGSIVGALILLISPYLSQIITKSRNGKKLPYQGLGITFLLLIIVALIFQFIL